MSIVVFLVHLVHRIIVNLNIVVFSYESDFYSRSSFNSRKTQVAALHIQYASYPLLEKKKDPPPPSSGYDSPPRHTRIFKR